MADHPIKARIVESMKDAMRARDKARLGTIRLILADFKKVEVDERIDVDDARAVALLDKMVKQRRESIKQYEAGGRAELAAVEQAEIVVIQDFLPAALGEDEVADIIRKAIAESGASDMKAMGAVMNIVRPQLTGRADLSKVSQLVKQLLA